MSQVSPPITRRRVAKGAAWTVPVMVVGAAAPATAASCPSRTCPVDISFGALAGTPTSGVYPGTANWGPQTVTGTVKNGGASPSKQPGFRSADPLSSSGAGPWFGVGDEAVNGATIAVSIKNPVTLVAGCSYTLSLVASTYQGQAGATLNVTVGSQTVLTVQPPTGSAGSTGSAGPLTGSAQTSAPFTVPTTTTYSVGMSIVLASAGSGSNNDIYVSNPQINCVQ